MVGVYPFYNNKFWKNIYQAAAGNKNIDAKDTFPANCPCVNTVGVTNIKDNRYILEHDDGTVTGSNFSKLSLWCCLSPE